MLAGYIGWGSFGQELFQGSWERPVYKDEGIPALKEWLKSVIASPAWRDETLLVLLGLGGVLVYGAALAGALKLLGLRLARA